MHSVPVTNRKYCSCTTFSGSSDHDTICLLAYHITIDTVLYCLCEGYQNNLKVLYSQTKLPGSCQKTTRHIPQAPDRILDAPDLLDDYCEF